MFVETYMDTDHIIKIYFYYLRNYCGQPGFYTTYHARGYDLFPHGLDYLPFLGEYIIYEPPGDFPPYLWTNYEEEPEDRYKRAYYFVVTPRPYLTFDAPIAWTKTINFFTDLENWWAWELRRILFYLREELLSVFYLPVFSNFPHPQGHINDPHPPEWPDYWPGDITDHCHVDWCFYERWPDELPTDYPAYGHGGMTLEMIIDDWGTFDEMWKAYILDRGRWVQ